MSRAMFISDLHFDHKNICKHRPEFESVEHHNEFILDRILTTVRRGDSLWLLGDICFSHDAVDNYMIPIRCAVSRVNLVLGNHCAETEVGQNNIKRMLKQGLIDKVYGLVSYKGAWLSHAPIHDSELRGKWCLHGHTHNTNIDDPRYFNVSCENINYTPMDFTEIKAIMKRQMEEKK